MARNHRIGRYGEIDVIAANSDVLAFVEVKTRHSDRYGPPSAAVGPEKQRRLRRLAAMWLAEHPIGRRVVRFDVVCVVGSRVDVIEGAF